MKAGIIGYNEGNGHPYSFSAICNGYDDKKMRKFGWAVIADYLAENNCNTWILPQISVTHVFCPQTTVAKNISEASNVPNVSATYLELLEEVDAVIIARDDWNSHFDLITPALEREKRIFVDKPLTLSMRELRHLQPYLETGQLCSCSGFRYSEKVNIIKNKIKQIGPIEKIIAVTMNDVAKYGIHLIEVLSSINPDFIRDSRVSVNKHNQNHVCHITNDNYEVQLEVIEAGTKIFKLIFVGQNGVIDEDINDNYHSFRGLLQNFHSSFLRKAPMFDPSETIDILTVIAQASDNGMK